MSNVLFKKHKTTATEQCLILKRNYLRGRLIVEAYSTVLVTHMINTTYSYLTNLPTSPSKS